MRVLKAVKSLFSIFTILPINANDDDVFELSKRLWLIPLIGSFFGIISGSLLLFLNIVFSPLISATITIIMLHGINRFFHIDGLIDFGDGMVALASKDDKIKAMKDVKAGAGGIMYAILFTILAIATLSSLPLHLLFLAPFIAEVLSKNSMVICAAIGKPREEGIGSIFIKNTTYKSILPSMIISIILIFITTYPTRIFVFFNDIELIIITLISIITSCIIGVIVAKCAMKNFGCVTGDVLGATNEITRPIVLLMILIVIKYLEMIQL